MNFHIKNFILLTHITLFHNLLAQVPAGGGLIVNEINQGTISTSKEFIELLVLGDPSAPCDPVDLTGWVVDDNNGDFENCGAGVGIQTGHYRFTSCFSAVPPGSIIVIYNAADAYTGMPADDPTDADGNKVYIVPSDNSCLEANYTVPNSSDPDCGYAGPYITPTSTWAAGMSNNGDVAQVRKPDYSFYHGFSYGNVNTTYPAWPSGASSGTAFHKGSGNLAFDCGDFWQSANYFTTTAAAGTPGVANSVANGFFIGEILNCDLVYSDLTDIINCDLLLPVELISFSAVTIQENITLNWQLATVSAEDVFIIQRGKNPNNFSDIGVVNGTNHVLSYAFTDDSPEAGMNYYRLKCIDEEGNTTISKVICVDAEMQKQVLIYPNPATETLHLSSATEIKMLLVTDIDGKVIQELQPSESITISHFPAGIYVLKVITPETIKSFQFIKQ